MPKQMTWEEFSKAYCETQEATPESLAASLKEQYARFTPDGWMLLECQMMDSSKLGQKFIMPYGPNNTYKEPIMHPISRLGLASDMSVVIGLLAPSELH